ncbi:MAG: hypothetical protein LC808_36550 [Actinobacteria bacterium]|nr:hypothetical protein [Actinomycetota bacterium]
MGQGDERGQQGRNADTTVGATTQVPPTATTTTTTLVADLPDAALLTALEYPANQVAELASKAPVRSSFTTNRSSTVVLSFQRNRTVNTEGAAAVTQYLESIQDVRLTIDPLGTGPTVFEINSDPNTRGHIVVLLGASDPVPPWAQWRPIATQPIRGTTYGPTIELAVSLVRARTAKEANDIFAVETAQRVLLDRMVSTTAGSGVDRDELKDAGREQVINSLGVAISSAQYGTRYPVGGKFSFPGGVTLTYLPLSEFPANFPTTRVFS